MLNTMTETQRRAVSKAATLYEEALILMAGSSEDRPRAVAKRDQARAILERAHVNVGLDCH